MEWLVPQLDVHWSAYAFAAAAYVFELITTIIPRDMKKPLPHDLPPVLAGITMYATLVVVAASPTMTTR